MGDIEWGNLSFTVAIFITALELRIKDQSEYLDQNI